jgi:hypothetical protein
MPSLNWIGKEAVVNHHLEVPFRLLQDVPDLACGDPGSGNFIVEGDNLIALKALLPYYAGKVKCIYIDPPYNTGNEGWAYNDNVNSPAIRKWLGETVGKEGETLDRHDRWLCMMYPRLALLREFLADDGILFVSIDDIELPALRMILDEMFPHAQAKNRLACFVWETAGNFDNQAKVKIAHEYVLAYSKSFENCPPPPVIDLSVGPDSKLFRPEIRNTIVKNGPKNPVSSIVLPPGFPADFDTGVVPARSDKWPHYPEPLVVREGKLSRPAVASSGWASKAILSNFIAGGFQPVKDTKGQLTRFVVTASGAIEAVKVRSEAQSHVVSVIRDVGSTQSTSEALKDMGVRFAFPKPVSLVRYLISMVADKSAIVLDSFAGTGTTGHAVLQMNKDDPESQRRFILVQMPFENIEPTDTDTNLCRELTAKRIAATANGYTNSKGEVIPGLGGGFRYLRLGDALFDGYGRINEARIRFGQLARYVYFFETGEPLPRGRVSAKTPLLGIHQGRAVYLLYNGILKDRSVGGGNVLTSETLALLPAHDGPKVVYAAGCRFSRARLEREGITFKQTPYAIRTR